MPVKDWAGAKSGFKEAGRIVEFGSPSKEAIPRPGRGNSHRRAR
jgi:hypothetical protein